LEKCSIVNHLTIWKWFDRLSSKYSYWDYLL